MASKRLFKTPTTPHDRWSIDFRKWRYSEGLFLNLFGTVAQNMPDPDSIFRVM
ncbi:MAG: hypothetical protein HXS47_11020 [Theionarchaea archaeon]|nr:hypothetical protein [Theionarchaea archaeon]